MAKQFKFNALLFSCHHVGSILKDGNPEIPESDGPVEVCVNLQNNVTTDIDIEVTFSPQLKAGSSRPAFRMLITLITVLCVRNKYYFLQLMLILIQWTE